MLRADATGIALEWRAPAYSTRQVIGDDGWSYSALEAPGWARTSAPGQPQLLFATALAVVPPAGDVTVHVQTIESARRPLHHPVAPAPAPVPIGTPPARFEWEWARDEGTYAGTEPPRPSDAVTLEEIGWLRGRRLVRLTFYPLRFDPAGGALEVINQVRVELRFESHSLRTAQREASGAGRWGRDDPFIPVLQNSVVNPAQVIDFVRQDEPTSASPGGAPDGSVPDPALAGPPAGADYLIIAHSDFIDAVAPLAAHRASSDGLRVSSITVQEIYDAYSSAYDDHEAIKAYIDNAYRNWTPPALSYVLLVGDGVRDSSNLSQQINSGQNFVPPHPLTMNPPWCKPEWDCYPWETVSDNRFGTLDGPDDRLADVFIGRLPVNTAAEATTVVEKILAYEMDPPQWPWNERVLFFAGNESDAPYHQYSDEIYEEHLPSTFSGRRVYFCRPCESNCSGLHMYTDIDAARARTVHELDVGGLLASYVGHSSWHQWAVDPETFAPMFHLDDVASLDNGGALPVVLQMTCYTSDFSEPSGATLDETLLRRPGGGAVATWGSTTLGLSLGHSTLHREFFDAVFQDNTTELGQATKAGKLALDELGDPYYVDLIDTFLLLGDPAMDLNLDIVPWTDKVFLPVTLRRSPSGSAQ